MSKTIMMGDGKLSDEERASLETSKVADEQKQKELLGAELTKEQNKKKVTLEELLKTRIAPTEDRIVVWPDPVEMITSGGILKPKEVTDKERTVIGTVIAVGPGLKNDPSLTNEILIQMLENQETTLFIPGSSQASSFSKRLEAQMMVYQPGDRILYGRFAGTEVEDPASKEKILIMRPGDIFGKIKA